MAADEEYPGVSEAALALAEVRHEAVRARLLDPDLTPAESLGEDFVLPSPWSEVSPFGKTASAQQVMPTVMFVYNNVAEGIRASERTKQTVRLFSPEMQEKLKALIPDTVPNKEFVISAMLDTVADALSGE